jgi:hypothetical protein
MDEYKMNLDIALDTFDSLDFEAQNIFVEILNNRIREKRRDYIYQSYSQAKNDFDNGLLKQETTDVFFKRMDEELIGKI